MAANGFVLQIDDRDIREVSRLLAAIPDKIPKALAAGINRSLSRSKTVIQKEFKAATTLKSGRIAEDTYIVRATPANLTGQVSFSNRRGIGAARFKHRATKKSGASVQFLKNQPAIHFRHAFKATGRGGNVHLFTRRIKGGKPVPRLPLDALKGPTLRTIYQKNPQIAAAANRVVAETIRANLYSQVDRFLGRSKTAVPGLASLL